MKRRADHVRIASRAFTLVEVICAIAVMSVIGVLASRLVFTASDQYLAAASRSMIGAELSAAMERIATELRQIPAKVGVSPTEANLGSITPTSLAWTDAGGVSKMLSLSGSNLVLAEGANSYTLLANVSAFAVQAYDESNVALSTSLAAGGTSAVRRIEISITVTRNAQSETLRSRFFLRCVAKGGMP